MKPLQTVRALVSSQKGAALPLAFVVLLLVSVLGLTLVTLGMTEVSIGTNWRSYSSAFYGAQAGIESGLVGLKNSLTANPTNPNLAIAPPALNPTLGLAFANYNITQVNPAPFQMTFATGPYKAMSGVVTNYQITSQVTGPGGTRSNLAQIVQYVQVPLFQFGVFYGQGVDLEIAPGPNMTFNGRIHANSNIYVGAGSSLQFQSNMTTAGDIYRHIKRDSAIPWGNNPQIADASGILQTLNFDHVYQPGFTSPWASANNWMSQALSTFGGKVQDSAMGVQPIIPPIPALFDNPSNPDVVAHQMIELPQLTDSPALRAAKLYSQADLRIVDGVATDKNGNPVALPLGAITSTSFYDPRENKTMLVTQVDMSSVGSMPAFANGGVLYVASSGPASACGNPCPAVRLVNGATLPGKGLSVVSQNPMYIQGSYNTTTNGPVDPATGLQTHPPAAVLADAITVLSDNWVPNSSDTRGTQATNQRPASSTTVNAALATGPSAESAPGQGNGQLENDIRFLEDWTGQTLTYRGSIIDLWHSMQATAAWRCCGSSAGQYYNPPIRNWGYDTLFDGIAPPGTPRGVLILKGPWSQG
jgi:hypothetical protein